MSTPMMPTMPISMAKGLKKNPNFNSIGQKTAAGKGNSFVSLKPYPTWDFEWDMDSITGNEAAATSVMAQFLGTYMLCNGQTSLFLFTDPQDNIVTTSTGVMLNVTPGAVSPMGMTGDGVSTQFQLARLIGGVAPDIIQNLNGSATVQVNGVTTSVSVSSKGVVTFSVAPVLGATLTWSGNFFYLCRFDADTVDAVRSFTTNSGTDQWNVASIKFSSEFI